MRISKLSYTFEDATSLYVKFQYYNMLFADEKNAVLSLGLLKMGKYCNLKLIRCESGALEIICHVLVNRQGVWIGNCIYLTLADRLVRYGPY